MPYVYLLHFETPLKHAQHYLGSAKTLRDRIARHRQPSDPTKIIHNGFKTTPFVVARTWKFGGVWNARKYEKHLKRVYKNARYLCPICKEAKKAHDKEIRDQRKARNIDKGGTPADQCGKLARGDQFEHAGAPDVGVGGTATQGR